MQPTNPTNHLSLRCPSCQARLRASRDLLGQNCPCPRCRHPIVVRVPIPADSDIALVLDPRKAAG